MRLCLPAGDYIQRKGFSVSANLATRRAVFDAVGPFAGIEIAEDTDWGQRATRMGLAPSTRPRSWSSTRRGGRWRSPTKWDRNISHHYEAFARRARRAR